MFNPDNYTVGWVCALSKEFTAAKTMLDENHPPCSIPNRDTNHYALGKIGNHNVVIAVLPDGEYGLSTAANVATNMLNAFPNIRIGLLVGIGGGAPTSQRDIRLGDVVVSSAGQGTGGVFQYDFGRAVQDMEFQTTGFLNRAPTALRTAISALKTEHDMNGHRIQETIGEGLQRYPRMRRKYSSPPRSQDRLYLSTSAHPSEDGRTCDEACGEGTEAEPKLVKRDERSEEDDDPEIHYGIIASADQLMKDAKIRDKLSSERGIICFEMEAAGLVNTFPCIVIRGVCDYADTHKNDEWQGYAAMTAAAYAKELLRQVLVTRIEEERRINEVLGHLSSTVDEIKSSIVGQSEVLNVINSRAESDQYREIIDKLPYVKDAAFDSHSEEHNPKCLENTRVNILTQILQWVKNGDSNSVFWLNGMAGTGKSTISRTVCQILFSKGMLGASFFFKRGYADQGSAAKFCTTIARQLALNRASLGTFLQSAIKEDPDIGNRGLRLQFEKLIMRPLAEVAKHQSTSNSTIAIIVDALDECNPEQDVRLLISLFSQLGKVDGVKLRAFLTSRPDLPIRLGFKAVTGTFQDLILHQIPRPVIEHDISAFFRYEISRIVLEWNKSVTESRRLSIDWPGEDNLRILTERAIPLFIFAATMCRFISDRNSGPKTRLNQIIGSARWTVCDQMQATYAPVLDQLLIGLSPGARTDAIREFKTIVGAIVLLETPLPIDVLSRLIDVDQDRIHDRLDKLHSVLDIPQSPGIPVRLFHLSFRDYLIDVGSYPGNEFMIEYIGTSHNLAANCLGVMRAHLKADICDLRHPGTARVDINKDLIHSHLPPELQYACVHWVKHQGAAILELADTQSIMEFLKIHLLHWIEVLVLLDRPWEIAGLLKTLRTVCMTDTLLTEFLEDALRFLNFSITIVNAHPLQLYSHALLFAPENSLVNLNFKSEIPRWVSSVPNMTADWGSCLRGFESTTRSITFVPDTTWLFVELANVGFKVLDWDTGECFEAPRSGKPIPDGSPVLSPDGKTIALPTSRRFVEITEFLTGTILGQLPADCDVESELCFSPNSKLLSVSTKEAWQIWDWEACRYLYRVPWSHDHNAPVRCGMTRGIFFSADSALLMASTCLETGVRPLGPCRHMLRIWKCRTGECVFQRTISSNPSFMFTPDSKGFLFISTVDTIEVWSTSTFSRLHDLSTRYINHIVEEIQISADSKLLACADGSQLIYIFNLAADQPFSRSHIDQEGYTFFCFTPDSRHVMVGDPTGGIQVYYTCMKGKYTTSIGHGDIIDSAVFSADHKILATKSRYTSQLKIWDWEREVVTSKRKHALATSAHRIRCVRLSPDLRKLAVIYLDMTEIYDITLGSLARLFYVSRESEFVDSFSSDSKFFSFYHSDGRISALDASTGACVWDSYAEDRHLEMSFSDDSQWLAVTTTPIGELKVESEYARILISKHVGDVFIPEHTIERRGCYNLTGTRFSSNARFVAALDIQSSIVLVWNLQRPLDEPFVIEGCSYIAAFSHSFLAAEDPGTRWVNIWNVASRRCCKTVEEEFGYCFFSPSERLLAIGDKGSVTIFDLGTGVSLVQICGAYTPVRWLEPEPSMSFLPGDAGIRTPMGIFEIPQEILAPAFPPSSPKVIRHTPLFDVCRYSGWIEWRGKKLLKLPAECDRRNAVVSNTQVILTIGSRRLVMIGLLDSELSDALLS